MERFWITAKTGERFLVRLAKPDDLEGLLSMITELIEERSYILMKEPPTLEEERVWLERGIKNVKEGRVIHWVVEKNGKLVGGLDASRRPLKMSHLVEIGIALLKEARGKGLGERLLRKMIDEILKKWTDPIIISISVFSLNERARALYKKVGFVEVARFPFFIDHFGEYCDLHMMYWKDSPLLRKMRIKL
jgi:RimJ/RimL family protein N-acetyltransferase